MIILIGSGEKRISFWFERKVKIVFIHGRAVYVHHGLVTKMLRSIGEVGE